MSTMAAALAMRSVNPMSAGLASTPPAG